MLKVTRKTLVILSALVWYAGGINLLLKGRRLLLEAGTLNSDLPYHWGAVIIGLLLGTFKAVALFRKNCRKNIDRINSLENFRIWQFFRPRFFILLVCMITAGFVMTYYVRGHYWGLLSVGTLDISLSTALLISSLEFWRRESIEVEG